MGAGTGKFTESLLDCGLAVHAVDPNAQMLEQAARLLAEAKALHDQLEGYYTGAMDFAAVDAVGERTLQKYEHIFQSYGL